MNAVPNWTGNVEFLARLSHRNNGRVRTVSWRKRPFRAVNAAEIKIMRYYRFG